MTETPSSKNFQLNDDDVVSMETNLSIIGTPTFRAGQLAQDLKRRLALAAASEAWVAEGMECELLSASSGLGWQTGKIRIRFEFVPDVPNVPDVASDPDPLDPLWEQ